MLLTSLKGGHGMSSLQNRKRTKPKKLQYITLEQRRQIREANDRKARAELPESIPRLERRFRALDQFIEAQLAEGPDQLVYLVSTPVEE